MAPIVLLHYDAPMNPLLASYQWYSEASGRNDPQICSTRDLFQARLDTMYRELIARSTDESEAALLTAVAGEIGNNCYDHNLGQWRDIHGCWFQHGSDRKRYWPEEVRNGEAMASNLSDPLSTTTRPGGFCFGQAKLCSRLANWGRRPDRGLLPQKLVLEPFLWYCGDCHED